MGSSTYFDETALIIGAHATLPQDWPKLDGRPLALHMTGTWRVVGDTVEVTPRTAGVRTVSGWHDINPATVYKVSRQRARLEDTRLIMMDVAPSTIARLFERDQRPIRTHNSTVVTPADLLGRWVEVGDTTGTFTDFFTDSTWVAISPVRKGAYSQEFIQQYGVPLATMVRGSWRMDGDTLATIPRDAAIQLASGWRKATTTTDSSRDLMEVTGKRLTLTTLGPNAETRVFEGVDIPLTPGAGPTAADTVRPSKP